MTGENLKKWVDGLGQRPEALALRLGVSVGTLYRWFRMAQVPRRIAVALELMGYTEQEHPRSAAG